MERKQMYVGGRWIGARSGEVFGVTDPATLEEIALVPNGGKEDALAAVESAYEAFAQWREMSAYERSAILLRWHDLIMEHKEEIARTITREQGKPLAEARGEVAYAASFVSWYAEEGKRVYGETIPATVRNKRLFVIKQPVGVVAAITPWNFPAAMITRKVAPALAVGCTCVVKPAEQTPLTALFLAELAEKAGFPAGVFNVITGDPREIGEALLKDPRVTKVTFTGSTEVGKLIMRGAADTVKKISLELGGHAPVIVFDDADLETAVEETIRSKFRNAGQTCVCANRIYVQKGIAEAFAQAFAERAKSLKVGCGFEEDVAIGPVIDEQGLEKIQNHVEDAVAKGAKILTGGRKKELEGYKGYFFEPTVITGVTNGMRVMQEETFGPVAPIVQFEDEEEAIRLANETRYGLAAYLFTSNINRAIRVAERLDYGIVGLNDGIPATAQAPFGGYKESGLGREGGHYGMEEFLEVKFISLGLK